LKKKLSLGDVANRADSAPASAKPAKWGASGVRHARLKDDAREMRRHPTEAEKLLWASLKGSQLGGFKFRHQLVVGSSIVDFACPSRWLVVEVSGEEGANPVLDERSDRKLTDVGLRVLRFTSQEVTEGLDGVLQAILTELQKPFDKTAPQSRSALAPEVEGR
jgi:very-short-patch-repair endonuclease